MMKTIKSILILFVSVQEGLGFTTSINIASRNGLSVSRQLSLDPFSSQTTSLEEVVDDEQGIVMMSSSSIQRKNGMAHFSLPSIAGFVTGIASCAAQGIAAEDYEIVELPPPIVPAIFAVGLLVGVGLLTSTLGNVMDEEAQLGLQSGARAKKEIERSRSSYFGKRK